MSVRLENHPFYSRVYSRAMASNLLNLFFRHYSANPTIWDKSTRLTGADLAKLKEMRDRKVTHKKVDGYLTAKIGGPLAKGMWPFEGADEYYAFATSHKLLHHVKR